MRLEVLYEPAKELFAVESSFGLTDAPQANMSHKDASLLLWRKLLTNRYCRCVHLHSLSKVYVLSLELLYEQWSGASGVPTEVR